MSLNLQKYLEGLTRSSKKDDIPGTVEAYLDELCPLCSEKLKIMKPCCAEKYRTKVCVCGWKRYME